MPESWTQGFCDGTVDGHTYQKSCASGELSFDEFCRIDRLIYSFRGKLTLGQVDAFVKAYVLAFDAVTAKYIGERRRDNNNQTAGQAGDTGQED